MVNLLYFLKEGSITTDRKLYQKFCSLLKMISEIYGIGNKSLFSKFYYLIIKLEQYFLSIADYNLNVLHQILVIYGRINDVYRFEKLKEKNQAIKAKIIKDQKQSIITEIDKCYDLGKRKYDIEKLENLVDKYNLGVEQ